MLLVIHHLITALFNSHLMYKANGRIYAAGASLAQRTLIVLDLVIGAEDSDIDNELLVYFIITVLFLVHKVEGSRTALRFEDTLAQC